MFPRFACGVWTRVRLCRLSRDYRARYITLANIFTTARNSRNNRERLMIPWHGSSGERIRHGDMWCQWNTRWHVFDESIRRKSVHRHVDYFILIFYLEKKKTICSLGSAARKHSHAKNVRIRFQTKQASRSSWCTTIDDCGKLKIKENKTWRMFHLHLSLAFMHSYTNDFSHICRGNLRSSGTNER